jgi:hypothetical protein
LLPFVRLDQVVKYLLDAHGVGLQRWNDIRHRPFHQDAIDQPEALSVARKWSESFQDEPI